MKSSQLERTVKELFSHSNLDVVRAVDLTEEKAESYKKYFEARGYIAVIGAVKGISDKTKPAYEVHIWRKR